MSTSSAKSALVIAIGASLGAWLRWLLGIKLNALFPTIPPGTVVANMVGGYIIGLVLAFLAASPSLSPEWCLLIITGFCGGLTTFSTFSAETVALIQEGRLLWAFGSISLHVVGSLVMTAAGLLSYQMIGTR
ncbi:fluoride efflux transporter CrcB [Pseudomonas sp. LS2P72]